MLYCLCDHSVCAARSTFLCVTSTSQREQTACAGIRHEDVRPSRKRLLDYAKLAADTAEHMQMTMKQHSANGAEAGNSDGLFIQTERAAALRIHLQQLQVRLGASCCRIQSSHRIVLMICCVSAGRCCICEASQRRTGSGVGQSKCRSDYHRSGHAARNGARHLRASCNCLQTEGPSIRPDLQQPRCDIKQKFSCI